MNGTHLHLQFCGDTTLRDGLRFHDNEPVQPSIPKICARSSPHTLLPLPIRASSLAVRFAGDSPLEQRRFELSVPP
jgi:hypothetical protein